MSNNLNLILKLGNPKLYEASSPLKKDELPEAREKAHAMAELVTEYRRRHGAGRAIAAPQIGYMKRMIVLNINRPQVLINPVLEDKSHEMIELWDDCMSFPNLLVRVRRHKSCRIRFLNRDWKEQSWWLEDDLSELLQHEYDHLDGILATQRAIDERAFALKE
ncbi:MAG: peptide deformylase [Bacteroidales bacterium]|nr:peptide deformylase [Bacteroidales bacterium]